MYKSLRRYLSTWNSLFTINTLKAKQAPRPVPRLCQIRKTEQVSFPKAEGRADVLSWGSRVSADALKPQPCPSSSPGDLEVSASYCSGKIKGFLKSLCFPAFLELRSDCPILWCFAES